MAKFDKTQFDFGHGSERWVMYGPDRKFVARFKYHAAAANARDFVKFLIANFTIDEYFDRLDAGETPLKILESKGYVSYNLRKAFKQTGATTATEHFAILRSLKGM